MEEINKKTLIEALSSLREHEPPDDIWDNVNMELKLGLDEFFPKEALYDLPEYDPPTQVWSGIVRELWHQGHPKIVKLNWRKPLAIAASLALLLTAYFLIKEVDPPLEISLKYSSEKVDDALLKKDWKDDEEAFEIYHELCTTKKYICEHPEFQMLQQEFDELSEAMNEIELAIGDFGTNTDLIVQIKEIELERTDIFKKMMVMLI